MQPEEANRLQEAVMEGRFDQAVQLLPLLMQGPHLWKQVLRLYDAATLQHISVCKTRQETQERGNGE